MNYRSLGRTGFNVSEISFGAWAIGGSWGDVDDATSLAALNRAIDLGVNFIDTADVYGDGRSERLIAQLSRTRSERLIVATKAGRRAPSQALEHYTKANLTAWVERSLANLRVDAIDLLQLHCPPTDVYHAPDVFGTLDDLVTAGKLRFYGVSVETVDEAFAAIQHPNVQSVQIIFNAFRLKPADSLLTEAKAKQVGILARVPLASGMLTGKMSKQSAFAKDDHRNFNRHGQAFDVGETFSGVDYDVALQAVDELKQIAGDVPLARFALRWITMFDAVTCAIPGAKTPEQSESNFTAGDLPPLTAEQMAKVRDVYDRLIRPGVHQRW